MIRLIFNFLSKFEGQNFIACNVKVGSLNSSLGFSFMKIGLSTILNQFLATLS